VKWNFTEFAWGGLFMFTRCGKSGFGMAVAALCACVAVASSARAALVDEARLFLSDKDRAAEAQADIIAGRAAMAADLANNQALSKDVRAFFKDRAELGAVRALLSFDRRNMRLALGYKGAKLSKPVKGSGVLAVDAASYIASFDKWIALQQTVEADIAKMRADVAAKDEAALAASVTAFFDDSRARLQARLQWQSDIRAMKKAIGFKGTGKPAPPPGSTLAEHVTEFLKDRGSWETLGATVDADRENIRATLGDSGSLASTVSAFLNDRRARGVNGGDLAFDRKAMRADLGLGGGESKSAGEVGAKDADKEGENDALEESPEGAGE
jgi:hypothetical protein